MPEDRFRHIPTWVQMHCARCGRELTVSVAEWWPEGPPRPLLCDGCYRDAEIRHAQRTAREAT